MKSLLEFQAEINCIIRKHYGNDKSNSPNLPKEDYFWDPDGLYYGWSESDASLRNRIEMQNKKVNK